MTAEAIARHIPDFAALPLVVDHDEREAQHEALHGQMVVTVGSVCALARLTSQDAFDAGIDFLSSERFLSDAMRLFANPAFDDLVREVRVRQLGPTQVADPDAGELLDDLLERVHLGAVIPDGERPLEGASFDEGLARLLACVMGLSMASQESPARWASWMPGMLWHEGQRGLLEMAAARGIGWEAVYEKTRTPRDRRLAALPFDRAASDEALRLLGLDA